MGANPQPISVAYLLSNRDETSNINVSSRLSTDFLIVHRDLGCAPLNRTLKTLIDRLNVRLFLEIKEQYFVI